MSFVSLLLSLHFYNGYSSFVFLSPLSSRFGDGLFPDSNMYDRINEEMGPPFGPY